MDGFETVEDILVVSGVRKDNIVAVVSAVVLNEPDQVGEDEQVGVSSLGELHGFGDDLTRRFRVVPTREDVAEGFDLGKGATADGANSDVGARAAGKDGNGERVEVTREGGGGVAVEEKVKEELGKEGVGGDVIVELLGREH